MTASLQPESKFPSRRALLAGALGGLGALVASAIGRPAITDAGSDGDVVLGMPNPTNFETTITNAGDNTTVLTVTNTHAGIALRGISATSTGVYGQSDSLYGAHGSSSAGYGVFGDSSSGTGMVGSSTSNVGVYGISASAGAATIGRSDGNGTGVLGASASGGPAPAAKAKTGVYGYAAQDTSSRGVIGESPAGIGVYGISSTGYGVYSSGKVYTTKWYEMGEISTPTAPPANRARLFVRDNGSGLTQLCVRFNIGSVKVLATQT
jgi:hypothetical protein